jgi:hypothetical protein
VAKSTTVTIRAAIVGTALVAALAFSGVRGAALADAGVARASCTNPTGAGHGYNASIGNRQNGQRVCLAVGEKLLVLLSAPPSTGLSWHDIQARPAGVVTVTRLTILLPRGVTAANFLADHKGVAELTSQRQACSPPPKSSILCGAVIHWQATLVVLGPRSSAS